MSGNVPLMYCKYCTSKCTILETLSVWCQFFSSFVYRLDGESERLLQKWLPPGDKCAYRWKQKKKKPNRSLVICCS